MDDDEHSIRDDDIRALVQRLLEEDRVQMDLDIMENMELMVGHTWPGCHAIQDIPLEGLRGLLYGTWSASRGFDVCASEAHPFLADVAINEFAPLGRTLHLHLVVITAELARRGEW